MAGPVLSRGKICKLFTHQKNFSENELLINLKEFPEWNLKKGDVVEIYHLDNQSERLLLEVKECQELPPQKDSISVSQYISKIFKLSMYRDVIVNPVIPKNVALDLVELIYKDQYFSKADMWRLRQSLVKSCVYLQKKVHFAEMKAQANELWAKGEKVTCGVVTEDTRVTFRSSSAQVNIFIQMSSEMWDFDNYGDLYFEKAIGGFLVELFNQWKEMNCNHDVTITLFSRTFYEANSIEDFPMHMRECVQRDNQGHFYEDFYRVVVQNERYDDWVPTVIQLKKLFLQYPERVLRYHEREDTVHRLRAFNSKSSQGNFLEVLNMALNAFEKHYLDRSFDRTGKLSIVITPGTGVFEVDRELMNITKQRTIDCGNGSDLVCMGEQPLHAVPLFKFHSRNPPASLVRSDVGDDYSIPHWINHSFYTSRCQAEAIKTSRFLPRIQVPQQQQDVSYKPVRRTPVKQRLSDSQTGNLLTSLQDDVNFPFVDYDDYDAHVFKLPNQRVLKQTMSVCQTSATRHSTPSNTPWQIHACRVRRIRCNSDISYLIPEERSNKGSAAQPAKSTAIIIPKMATSADSNMYMSNSYGGCSNASTATEDDVFIMRPVVGSAGSPVGHQGFGYNICRPVAQRRALINPFAPSRLHFKVTSNRRRWAHAFPTDPRGASIQPHHIHSSSETSQDQTAKTARVRTHQTSESSDGLITEGHGRIKRNTVSSTESGSEDSNSVKDQALSALPAGASATNPSGMQNSSAVNLPKVGSTSSLSSIYNMYDLHGSAGSAGRGRSWTQSGGMNAAVLSGGSSTVSRAGVIGYGSAIWSPGDGGHHSYVSGLSRGIEEGHNWLWGTTGEQEWTPETTTGMDWKSMTMPASLPITTDYFPDKRSLQNDYVMSNYELLPDDVNSDWNTASRSVRKPLSTAQVYRELVAQRLAQGFQLVILLKRSLHSPGELASLSSSPYQQPHSAGSLLRARSKPETVEEHILSIGRIFHKLSMKGNIIKVKRYWPRHPYQQKSIHYTYRFQVPDSDSYDVSWTNFSYEKLENYNWNYVDQYILTRGGEDDYSLMESLKYWRSRFCLLPSNNQATKKIIEGSERCDIYKEMTVEEQEHLIDGFLRFIEIMNKIKRPAQSRKPKMALLRCHSVSVTPTSVVTSPAPEKEKMSAMRRHSGDSSQVASPAKTSHTDLPRCQTMSAAQRPAGLSVLRDRQMAVRRHSLTQSPVGTLISEKESMSKTKSVSKSGEGVDSLTPTMASPIPGALELKKKNWQRQRAQSSSSVLASAGQDMTPMGSTGELATSTEKTFNVKSPVKEIRDAMLDSTEGLSFLTQQPGLPSLPAHTFVAAEAVTWVKNNIDGVVDLSGAINLLQTLVDEQMICHASGNPDHCFIYGFFLYHVVIDSDKKKELKEFFKDKTKEKVKDMAGVPSSGVTAEEDPSILLDLSKYYYNTSFQYEWCEVAVHLPTPPPTLDGAHSNGARAARLPPESLQGRYLRTTTSPRAGSSVVTAAGNGSGGTGGRAEHDWGGRSTNAILNGSTSYKKTMGTPDLMLDLMKLSSSGASPMYKVVNVDVDPANKSDRQEWGTARYHGNYNPCCAFELEVQWLVATGCIMGDLVNGWSRKASSYGFHFLPIPGDPFALPFNANSDPLRGPIFVPLNVHCLLGPDQQQLFDEDDSVTAEEQMLIFQESILKQFGFMPDRCLPGKAGFAFGDDSPPQYVHCTGGMFVLIPDIQATSPRNRDGTHRKPTVGTYLDYILHQRRRSSSAGAFPESIGPAGTLTPGSQTSWSPSRHGSLPAEGLDKMRSLSDTGSKTLSSPPTLTAGLSSPSVTGGTPRSGSLGVNGTDSMTDAEVNEARVGFLWAWNYMLNKKWRTNNTGDEHFQDRMLADFRAFCANEDDRLLRFWLDGGGSGMTTPAEGTVDGEEEEENGNSRAGAMEN